MYVYLLVLAETTYLISGEAKAKFGFLKNVKMISDCLQLQ